MAQIASLDVYAGISKGKQRQNEKVYPGVKAIGQVLQWAFVVQDINILCLECPKLEPPDRNLWGRLVACWAWWRMYHSGNRRREYGP